MNLKTTRLQEMIDWYVVVVVATVNIQSNNIAFISNDRTHHRIALLAVPGMRDDPEKFVHSAAVDREESLGGQLCWSLASGSPKPECSKSIRPDLQGADQQNRASGH